MRKTILWVLAFTITIGLAIYQKKTGPTWPVDDTLDTGSLHVAYSLERSHGGEGDQEVTLHVVDGQDLSGTLYYKRYRTEEDWTPVAMLRVDTNLTGFLPHQPPAGKLAYFIEIQHQSQVHRLPEQGEVVTRFKGDVPIYWLLPHIVLMFSALMLAVRTGLGIIFREDIRKLVIIAFWLLLVGGMILGPIVQKYAFDEFWTGVPYGFDLTDNKTLIAFVFWGIAFLFTMREGKKKWKTLSVIVAVVVMMAVYLIPHSTWGSEYDYSRGTVVTGQRADSPAP
ncbi:MAG: hypothetical protein JXQ27_00160 [Acidobacteria bacterium]|nr:hypothetical protein [Acidobacteriota bacterium]